MLINIRYKVNLSLLTMLERFESFYATFTGGKSVEDGLKNTRKKILQKTVVLMQVTNGESLVDIY